MLWRRVEQGGAGTCWALLTALTIAAYSLVDKGGVGIVHPVPFITVMFLGMNALLWPAVGADGGLKREWARHRSAIRLAALCTSTAYVPVLFAFRLSKAGYAAAGREVSIVPPAVVGSVVFKEDPLRAAAGRRRGRAGARGVRGAGAVSVSA